MEQRESLLVRQHVKCSTFGYMPYGGSVSSWNSNACILRLYLLTISLSMCSLIRNSMNCNCQLLYKFIVFWLVVQRYCLLLLFCSFPFFDTIWFLGNNKHFFTSSVLLSSSSYQKVLFNYSLNILPFYFTHFFNSSLWITNIIKSTY